MTTPSNIPTSSCTPQTDLHPGERAALAQLLTQMDAFLRSNPARIQVSDGGHTPDQIACCRPADLLAAFLSTGPTDSGRTAANCLIDLIGFTALNLSRPAQAALPDAND
ncbi:hypothetical protein ACFXJ8_43225 [Nonomuraea sp. NPDC059194]|uniref:hypothetical protein n=1 Tax=Nonomuraea sp. NPDC059194 TaxID=3346764 RepID=UPI0036BE730B